ncbi:hypothetical protein SAMD00023353_1301270 [Rosellinia necatrix]|uniref:Uncharacterized protein n=1 Tax=Rosellinia necatrix TaxID=77044 RepID=A0A1S8A6W1_ROSNE|nr:hypothetical protein SAMD00023353_1301270 [Rosellinia necatrix]
MDPQLSLLRTGQEGNGPPFGNESNPDLKAVDTDLKIQPRDAVPASLPPDTVSKNASPNVALENASSHKHIPVELSRRKQAETVSQDHHEKAAGVSSEKGRSEEPQQPSIKEWIGAGLSALGKATVIRPKPTASAPVTALEPEIAETSNITEPSGEQNKAFGVDRAEAGAPKLPSLISLSYLPGSSGIDVVAVHDPGQSWKEAWIYAPDKGYARRPRDPTPRPANASQLRSPEGRLGPGTQFTPQNEVFHGNKDIQHIESWKLKIEPAETPSGGEKRDLEQATSLAIPGPGDNETPATSANRGNIAAAEKGKRRADTDGSRESGRQSLAKELFNSPKPENASETKLNDDDMSHRSHSTASIHKEVRQLSEKGKDSKDRTWLTDPTMLLGDLGEARVLAFTYPPLTQTQPTKELLDKEGYGKYLEETAGALLSQLKTQRKGDRSGTPLIFIATARGCSIVQKLITLIAEDAATLAMIAAIIFDPGSTREEPETVLKLASDKEKDSQTSFYQVITKNELETVWFYTQQDTSRVNKPNRFDEYRAIKFIKQETIAEAGQPRFKSQWDSNYTRFRNEIKRCLVLWVSAKKEFEKLLKEFINRNYNLDIRDYQQRSPIHRAVKCANYPAVMRLVSAEPELVVAQDNTLSTALHIAVKGATVSSQEDRIPYQLMIETLVATFEEIQKDDEIKDESNKSPWDYALGDECQWIHELALFNGARVAKSTAIDETKELPEEERIACESSRATLAQFYIAGDHKSDFLRLQTLDIYSTIYSKQDGIERWFDRKRISTRSDDKLPTCRWIHLPANNVGKPPLHKPRSLVC